jgi:hypothetical protein
MIDWKKEIATKNYCGYCIGSPPSANCDGSCFKESKENRVDHTLEMLKMIPEQIEQLKKREQDFRDALSA